MLTYTSQIGVNLNNFCKFWEDISENCRIWAISFEKILNIKKVIRFKGGDKRRPRKSHQKIWWGRPVNLKTSSQKCTEGDVKLQNRTINSSTLSVWYLQFQVSIYDCLDNNDDSQAGTSLSQFLSINGMVRNRIKILIISHN